MNRNLPETGFSMETVLYKEINGIELFMDVYRPDERKTDASLVLFFGGGWRVGERKALLPFAKIFSSMGMTVFLPDYRISSLHQSTPFDSVKDARSAMRFVKRNAERFGISPARVGAGGGSAGGHIAFCTFYIDINEEGEDTSITPDPVVLTQFNPVANTVSFRLPVNEALFLGRDVDVSPHHHIRPNAPPTIIFHGSNDQIVSLESIKQFRDKSLETGNRCELVVYEGQEHGFFHHNKNREVFFDVISHMEKFIKSCNLL